MHVYRVLDLFSGIGGFSLGLDRAGFETVAFCEIDPFCRMVLAKHWPGVKVHEDIKQLDGSHYVGAVDVICGGFPCQDISLAGKGGGIDGERSGLWREFARIIREVRPSWVIIENSQGLLGRGLSRVLGDLAAIGYDAEWSRLSACTLGFPHVRQRLFVVAYPTCERREQRGRIKFETIGDQARHLRERHRQSEPARVAHGIPNRMDRNRAIGNAVVPDIVQAIGKSILTADRCIPTNHVLKDR